MLNRNFHSNVNIFGRFYKHFLTSLYRSKLLDIFWSQTRNKNICKLNKGNSLKNLFSQFVSSKTFLQYKSQCLEKVNVKYVISRLWHEIFNIDPDISPSASLLGLLLLNTRFTKHYSQNVCHNYIHCINSFVIQLNMTLYVFHS